MTKYQNFKEKVMVELVDLFIKKKKLALIKMKLGLLMHYEINYLHEHSLIYH